MGWELFIFGLISVALFASQWPVAAGWLIGPRCPECRQARLCQVRDLGEEWGQITRFSSCRACGRHFRHDADALVPTTPASSSSDSDVTSKPPPR